MRKCLLACCCYLFIGTSLALAQTSSPDHPAAPAAPTDHSLPAAMPSARAVQPTTAASQPADSRHRPLVPGSLDGGKGIGSYCDSRGTAPCCEDNGGVCGPPGLIWASAEYLLWRIRDAQLPPLVSTGPATSPTLGAVGVPGTTVLFGGRDLDQGTFSGARFTVGGWLNQCQTNGIEVSYFFLAPQADTLLASSSGAPGSLILARPFFDVSTGLPNSELVSFPGLSSGSIRVSTTSRLQGAEANLLWNLCCSCDSCTDCCGPRLGYRVDLIGGPRYLDLKEGVGVAESIQVLPGSPVLAGTAIRAFDQFDTRNQFYGMQVGARAEARRNRLFANVTGKVALGDTHQTVDINGSTTFTPLGAPAAVTPGGLLALPSNIGHSSRDVFSVVPEVGVNLGYQVTDNLSVFVGYTFLYWSAVARPGDQIDFGVNSTRTPVSLVAPSGPARPSFAFRDADFWVQGVNFGLALRF